MCRSQVGRGVKSSRAVSAARLDLLLVGTVGNSLVCSGFRWRWLNSIRWWGEQLQWELNRKNQKRRSWNMITQWSKLPKTKEPEILISPITKWSYNLEMTSRHLREFWSPWIWGNPSILGNPSIFLECLSKRRRQKFFRRHYRTIESIWRSYDCPYFFFPDL